jgi:poly(A)-specific ribonuclease
VVVETNITIEYRAKTFNFLLTPSFTGHRPVDKRLAQCVDRYVGFSQSSIMFLRDHDFHMDQAFKHGVSYLSQSETQELGGKFLQTFDKLDPTDRLVLTDYDQQAIDFYNHAMNIINHWYTSKPREVSDWYHDQVSEVDPLTNCKAGILQYHESAWRQTECASSTHCQ